MKQGLLFGLRNNRMEIAIQFFEPQCDLTVAVGVFKVLRLSSGELKQSILLPG
jgi:hypothetical protein